MTYSLCKEEQGPTRDQGDESTFPLFATPMEVVSDGVSLFKCKALLSEGLLNTLLTYEHRFIQNSSSQAARCK